MSKPEEILKVPKWLTDEAVPRPSDYVPETPDYINEPITFFDGFPLNWSKYLSFCQMIDDVRGIWWGTVSTIFLSFSKLRRSILGLPIKTSADIAFRAYAAMDPEIHNHRLASDSSVWIDMDVNSRVKKRLLEEEEVWIEAKAKQMEDGAAGVYR